MYPRVSVIVVARNEEKILRDCLDSIFAMDYPKEKMEVILVDGLSTDRTRDIAAEYDVKIVTNPDKVLVAGYNKGYESSTGDLLAYCDADCVVDKDWVPNAIKYFQNPAVGAIGGPMKVPRGTDFSAAVGYFFGLASFLGLSFHIQKLSHPAKKTVHIPSCNIILTREAFASMFPIVWNESQGCDLEMSRKLLQNGFELLMTPDVGLWHRKKETPRSLWKEMFGYGHGRMIMMKKYHSYVSIPHIIAGCALPLFAVGCLLAALTGTLGIFAGAIGALVGLYALSVFVRSRSWKITLWSVAVLAIGPSAWSAGFLSGL